MTTGKTIALTRQIFVGKVMSLFLNMLSRLVITFLPKNTLKLKIKLKNVSGTDRWQKSEYPQENSIFYAHLDLLKIFTFSFLTEPEPGT